MEENTNVQVDNVQVDNVQVDNVKNKKVKPKTDNLKPKTVKTKTVKTKVTKVKTEKEMQDNTENNGNDKSTNAATKVSKDIVLNDADATKFECSICCASMKLGIRNKKVECPSCAFSVCISCQKHYGKLECMNCRVVFRNKWAVHALGAVFVSKTARQNKIRELMLQQREELKTIAPLVEWERRMREYKNNRKYGVWNMREYGELIKKPDRIMSSQSFACPCVGCRGNISRSVSSIGDIQANSDIQANAKIQEDHNGEEEEDANSKTMLVSELFYKGSCGLCRTEMCMRCQDKWHGDMTTCSPDTLETMIQIRADSKACPKCNVAIHRTAGCSHMHCTACDTHFDWNTRTILHNSSNYHYRFQLMQRVEPTAEEDCRISDDTPRIPEDIMQIHNDHIFSCYSKKQNRREECRAKTATLMDGLYNVPKAVRSMIRNEYSMAKIAEKTREKYDDLQIRYAMNEMTEQAWETQVYSTYTKQLVSELVSNILYLYLGNIDGFQSQLYNYEWTTAEEFEQFIDELMEKVDHLIEMANESISEIRYDYCPTASNQIMIRKLGETNQSYCTKQGIEKGKTTAFVKPIPQERANMDSTPIVPYDYQTAHIERLERILTTSHFAMDLSPLGTGKTYTAAKIYQNNGRFRHLLAISPLSVKTKWADVNEMFGLRLIENLTYNEIGGRRGNSPGHGLLLRNDYQVEVEDERIHQIRMIDKCVFTPTAYLHRLIADGLLVVFDEFQHLKNDTSQTSACQAIVVAIMDQVHSHSRVLFMSGSPIDKEDQVSRLFRTMGVMRHPRVVSGYQYAGINEVMDWIQSKFPDNVYFQETMATVSYYDHTVSGYIQNAETSVRYMYRWFVRILCGKMTSTMIATVNNNMPPPILTKYNGIFELDNMYMTRKIEAAIDSLHSIAAQMGNADAQARGVLMQQVTLRMMQIETAKTELFADLARAYLQKNANQKVVIAVNYSDTIREICSMLAEYAPLTLDGSKSFTQRRDILARFQKANNESRLLIGNFSVISTGIDLDDKDGRFPRVCLASPNYSTISIYQLGHRFLRGKETRSDTDIYMVYTDTPGERRITEALMRKGNVMKEVLSDQVAAGITFPSDYATVYRSVRDIANT